jgi:hypothetical protein
MEFYFYLTKHNGGKGWYSSMVVEQEVTTSNNNKQLDKKCYKEPLNIWALVTKFRVP